MAGESKDTVDANESTKPKTAEAKPTGEEEENNGFSNWGQPLNITIPQPFADMVRRMMLRGRWGRQGGRGCSPPGNRGMHHHGPRMFMPGQDQTDLCPPRMPHAVKQKMKKEKKIQKKQAKKKANITYGRLDNGDPIVVVDMDLAKAQKAGFKEKEQQEAEQKKDDAIMIDAQEGETSDPQMINDEEHKEEFGQNIPPWLRNQIKNARQRGGNLPFWMRNIVEKLDDAIENETKQQNVEEKADENEVAEENNEDELAVESENVPPFLKMGEMTKNLGEKKAKKMKMKKQLKKAGKKMKNAFKSIKRQFEGKKKQNELKVPMWLRNIIQDAAGFDIQNVLNDNDENGAENKKNESEEIEVDVEGDGEVEELSQEELLKMYEQDKKDKETSEKKNDKNI